MQTVPIWLGVWVWVGAWCEGGGLLEVGVGQGGLQARRGLVG